MFNKFLSIMLLLLFSGTLKAEYIPTEIIVFGDSLSSASQDILPIPDARNGTYVNRLADNLGVTGTNYARAGATSADMLSRLNNDYLSSSPTINSGTVHILNIGLNDGWWGGTLNQTILDDTISNVSAMLTELTNAGAQHIFLADYLNRGRNAGVYKFSEDNSLDFGLVSATIGANAKNASEQVLAAALAINPDIISLELGDFIEEIEDDPALWGFEPSSFFHCYYGQNPDFPCKEDPRLGESGTAPNDGELFYLDGAHLTHAAGESVGNFIADRIAEDASKVPSPAPFALLILGLIAMRVSRGMKR